MGKLLAAATTKPLEMEDGFAVPDLWYGKVQDRLTPASTSKSEARKKEPLLLARAGLSSYLYRLYITCVNLSVLAVVSTPPY